MARPIVQWLTGPSVRGGNGYGYAIAIDRTHEHLARHIDYAADADIALSFCCPDVFKPAPGKHNILVSMFESPDMPASCVNAIRSADACVVPSEFCRGIFQALTRVPVYVCQLGVEPVPFVARGFPVGRPFRWLWLGAFNVRKGWATLAHAWDNYFRDRSDCELYIKTTKDGPPLARVGNAIYDSRNVTFAELCEIYANAHAFVMPTLAEGFGQTIAEAQRSGLPCLIPHYSGHLEFADARTSYFVPYKMMRLSPGRGAETTAPDEKYLFAVTDPHALARTMEQVMKDYNNALVVGRRAARRVEKFTWEASAAKLAAILQEETQRIRRAA
jgi:glycosyltransferase involved in cell wall biosynthesis